MNNVQKKTRCVEGKMLCMFSGEPFFCKKLVLRTSPKKNLTLKAFLLTAKMPSDVVVFASLWESLDFEMERSAREPDRIDFKRQGCCASDLSLLTYF
jgi:hypothetical protein